MLDLLKVDYVRFRYLLKGQDFPVWWQNLLDTAERTSAQCGQHLVFWNDRRITIILEVTDSLNLYLFLLWLLVATILALPFFLQPLQFSH
jgi:hypothetical protein